MTGPHSDPPSNQDTAAGDMGQPVAGLDAHPAAARAAFEATSPIERELARFEQASKALAAAARAARAKSPGAAPAPAPSPPEPDLPVPPESSPATSPAADPSAHAWRRRATDLPQAAAQAPTPPAAPPPPEARRPAPPAFEATMLSVDSGWASASALDDDAAEPPGQRRPAPPAATMRATRAGRWRTAAVAAGVAALAGLIVAARWPSPAPALVAAYRGAPAAQSMPPTEPDAASPVIAAAVRLKADFPGDFAPPAAGPATAARTRVARDLAPPVSTGEVAPPPTAASAPMDAAARRAWRARHAHPARQAQDADAVESAIQDAQARADRFLTDGAPATTRSSP